MVEPWLTPVWREFLEYAGADRIPHALLLSGQAGIGKGALARRLGAWLLCLDPGEVACGACQSCALLKGGAHPERFVVTPPEDKWVIGVDPVRGLIASLALTTTISPRKVALLEPAEAMNVNAANALLKNLEEPPGDTVMILVSHDASRLPVTIRSRCQALRVDAPDTDTATDWLRAQAGCDVDAAATALEAAGGSPYPALSLVAEDGRLDSFRSLRTELVTVLRDPDKASAAAASLADLEPELVWRWLSLTAAAAARHTLGAGRCDWLEGAARLDARALLVLQRNADRNRRLLATAVRQDLLLQDWLLEWARQRSRSAAA